MGWTAAEKGMGFVGTGQTAAAGAVADQETVAVDLGTVAVALGTAALGTDCTSAVAWVAVGRRRGVGSTPLEIGGLKLPSSHQGPAQM